LFSDDRASRGIQPVKLTPAALRAAERKNWRRETCDIRHLNG
jgi:hypothetical protein